MSAPSGPAQINLDVTILTNLFQFKGKLPIMGVFQTFVNDDQRPTFTLNDFDALGVNANNPAAHLKQAEMFISKRICQIIAVSNVPQGGLQLMPRSESLAMYTQNYSIIGKFHLGPDARLNDFAEVSLSQFIIASEVRIFPLFDARPGVIDASPIALVHKTAIMGYHKF